VTLQVQSLNDSEDDQIRFEQELAEISAERDAIEKSRLTLLDEHEKLKSDMVLRTLINTDLETLADGS
jgi:hypothetical protein